MVDINGRSILRIAVEYCSRYGFDDVIINVHHLRMKLSERLDRLNREGFSSLSVSENRTIFWKLRRLVQGQAFS